MRTCTPYSCQVTSEERARLSRETVVDGALALTDAEGLEGLTIRRLAQSLGVTPMALYWHFKNKDELLDAVADRIWSLVDTEVDRSLPWPAQLRTIMERLVAVLRAHPSAASLVMTVQPDAAEACFATMEAALRILAEAGFKPAEAAAICRHGLRTATMLSIGDPGLSPKQTPEEAEDFLRHKRIALETLSPNRYPHVVEAASALAAPDDAIAYFDFGVDLFIAGVESLAPGR
jgi:TetR/AcrR family transcriptional regulator, tetracycline repressor protein